MIEAGQIWEHWATRSRVLVRELVPRGRSMEVRGMEATIDLPYRATERWIASADLLAWYWLVATIPRTGPCRP